MDRSVLLLLVGLVFGAGIGFTFAAANGVSLNGHDHAHDVRNSDHAHDQRIELSRDDEVPTLALEVTPDLVSGWNLRLMTTNFSFAPESAGGDNEAGKGHAHVFVNGAKLGRLYGEWMHLDNLPDGQVSINVTLNSNDHSLLTVGGVPIEKAISVSN